MATKQEILDEITDLLGMERKRLRKGGGSSLPADVFREAAARVGTRTGSMPVIARAIAEKAGHKWYPYYDSLDTPSGGGSTITRAGLRVVADSLRSLLPSRAGHSTFLLTWNPNNWEWPGEDIAAAIDATGLGQPVTDRWATGNRKQGISPGDRGFLLKQGDEPRGIIASCRFRGEIFQALHWDGTDRDANYAELDFEVVVDPSDPLPLATVKAAIPGVDWSPQGGGVQLSSADAAILETLWRAHVKQERHEQPRGQARQRDLARRKKIEDAAQDRLMDHYRKAGWTVTDTRIGSPFDAQAVKGGRTVYLEAKGTTTAGASVIVTRNEVAWALNHPGDCVIGIWSGISFTDAGEVDPYSGEFRIHHWEPEDNDLDPISYDWHVPRNVQIYP